MKRLYEGASVVSAILLLLTAAFAFIFNVHRQQDKIKHRRNEQKNIEKVERQKDRSCERYIEEKDQERASELEELNRLRKLQDPLWNYYDPEEEEYIVLPGRYRVYEPGKR